MKRFFEFLETAGIIFINPAEWIHEPKKPQNLPMDILAPKEAIAILDQPNLSTLKGVRDRAILELFYSTGIRRGELCGLSIHDRNHQRYCQRISGRNLPHDQQQRQTEQHSVKTR